MSQREKNNGVSDRRACLEMQASVNGSLVHLPFCLLCLLKKAYGSTDAEVGVKDQERLLTLLSD
jgi:hypothetical protein